MAQQDAIPGEPLRIVILSGVEGPLQCRRRLCCRSGFSRRPERRKTITACSEDDAAGDTSGWELPFALRVAQTGMRSFDSAERSASRIVLLRSGGHLFGQYADSADLSAYTYDEWLLNSGHEERADNKAPVHLYGTFLDFPHPLAIGTHETGAGK
jgi:hypothetical protein